ncbi:MAG: T9SS type A sorting domain-containing protein [Bacteroidota bacterium]
MKYIKYKYSLLIICALCCSTNVWAQNNDIFRSDTINGGGYDAEHFIQLINNPIFGSDTINGDGYDAERFLQLTNNDIFGGGVDDGYDRLSFTLVTNNNIFIGDGDDGYDQTTFLQVTNNSIFGGGIDDGYDLLSFIQLMNNDIFGGGIDDGYDLEGFVQMTNSNSIFGGGAADGYDLTSFVQLMNNSIFGGGVADGYDKTIALIEIVQSFSTDDPFELTTLKQLTFNTFPTPFSDYLNISIPENEEEPASDNVLSVINSKGTILSTHTFNGNQIRINVSQLPAGLYTILVQSGEKVFKSQVVKARSTISE